MSKETVCFRCEKVLKKGERVFEFSSGIFDGEVVFSDDSIELWCKSCEFKRTEE